MLVNNWMTTDIATVGIDDSMADAIRTMKERSVRMLPVMDGQVLAGVVTDRDLKRSSASDATSLEIHELLYLLDRIRMARIMTPEPITVRPDHTLEEAAQLLLKHRISGLPVVDDRGLVVGVIMQADLFRALIALTGIEKKGVQFSLELKDVAGSIREAADVVRRYGGRIISILSRGGVRPGWRRVYLRVFGIDRVILPDIVGDIRDCGRLAYMVDHRNDIREIYAVNTGDRNRE